jgi:hypothetical protein
MSSDASADCLPIRSYESPSGRRAWRTTWGLPKGTAAEAPLHGPRTLAERLGDLFVGLAVLLAWSPRAFLLTTGRLLPLDVRKDLSLLSFLVFGLTWRHGQPDPASPTRRDEI